MWQKNYQKYFKAVSSESIWNAWKDVNNWPRWHKNFEYCSLQGEFKQGSSYLLKAAGDPPVNIMLTEVIDGRTFTDSTKFFGAIMYNTHSIEELEDGVIVHATIRVVGPMKWYWVKRVAENIAESLPEKTDLLVEYATENALQPH